MNKISESIIVTYAKALRRIQTEQVDPYIELIEKELIKVYPELKDREDNALNWAYDIINADSTAGTGGEKRVCVVVAFTLQGRKTANHAGHRANTRVAMSSRSDSASVFFQ